MKTPPHPPHELLHALLDLLTKATLSLSLEGGGVSCGGEAQDELALQLATAPCMQQMRTAIGIESESVCRLALQLLAFSLSKLKRASNERAFSQKNYSPIYAILKDDAKPSSSRAAAASVLAFALDSCGGDVSEVEALCSGLAAAAASSAASGGTAASGTAASGTAAAGGTASAPAAPPPKPLRLLADLVSVSAAQRGGGRADISAAAIPTLLVALKAVYKLLDSEGERGAGFLAEAIECGMATASDCAVARPSTSPGRGEGPLPLPLPTKGGV